MTETQPRTYKLTPSLLTYQWRECKACFRSIVREGWQPPPNKMSPIFGSIDRMMRTAYDHSDPSQWSTLPIGRLETKEKQVISKPFQLPGFDCQFYFSGRTDALAYFGDCHGVIDFKTLHHSQKKTFDQFYVDTIALYSAQPFCYAWSLENPAEGKFHLPNVRHMGLLVAVPAQILPMTGSDMLTLHRYWMPIPRDDAWFRNFLTEVLTVLEGPEINNANDCRHCWDRHNSKMMDFVRQNKLLLPYIASGAIVGEC